MRTHDILGNVNKRSEQIYKGLKAIQDDTANGGWLIEEVRGKGVSSFDPSSVLSVLGLLRTAPDMQLMVAIEFKDPNSKLTRSHHLGDKVQLPPNLNKLVQDACYDRDLLVLTTSIYPVLRMIPALILSEEEVDRMLAVMAEAVKEVAKGVEQGTY